MLIRHDLGIPDGGRRRRHVLRRGRGTGTVETIFGKNLKFQHPYTEGLMVSILVWTRRPMRLEAIPGAVPHPNLPKGCNSHCGVNTRQRNVTQKYRPYYMKMATWSIASIKWRTEMSNTEQ